MYTVWKREREKEEERRPQKRVCPEDEEFYEKIRFEVPNTDQRGMSARLKGRKKKSHMRYRRGGRGIKRCLVSRAACHLY